MATSKNVNRKKVNSASIAALLALLVFSFIAISLQEAKAGKSPQPIYGLSNAQTVSKALGAWGVPAAVLIQGKRVRGFYVTGLTGSGIANDLGLSPRDVLLTLDGKGLDSGPAADFILQKRNAGNLKASIARQRGSKISTINCLVSFQGYTPQVIKPKVRMSGEAPPQEEEELVVGDDIADRPKPNIDALEDHMLQLINRDRNTCGLPPVAKSTSLSRLARAYAEDMAKRGFFDHRDPEGRMPMDRVREAGIAAGVWENIGWQKDFYDFPKIVEKVQFNFMNEPPEDPTNHRANILNPRHRVVGVGVAVIMPRTVYCVQEFSNDSPP